MFAKAPREHFEEINATIGFSASHMKQLDQREAKEVDRLC